MSPYSVGTILKKYRWRVTDIQRGALETEREREREREREKEREREGKKGKVRERGK